MKYLAEETLTITIMLYIVGVLLLARLLVYLQGTEYLWKNEALRFQVEIQCLTRYFIFQSW